MILEFLLLLFALNFTVDNLSFSVLSMNHLIHARTTTNMYSVRSFKKRMSTRSKLTTQLTVCSGMDLQTAQGCWTLYRTYAQFLALFLLLSLFFCILHLIYFPSLFPSLCVVVVHSFTSQKFLPLCSVVSCRRFHCCHSQLVLCWLTALDL